MNSDTLTVPFSENDVINALDLDRDNIRTIDVHHDGNNGLIIELSLNPTLTECPICHTKTKKIKGYRLRTIRHSIFSNIPCTIRYNARRYICPVCHKTFYENNHFISGGSRLSVATVYNVLKELKSPNVTFSDMARKYFISTTSIMHLFDKHISISRRPLPECLALDEVFAFDSKYSPCVCVLLDYKDKKLVDLLPSRKKSDLIEYFSVIPKEERNKVKYVSYDMWDTYRLVAKLMFPHHKGIVDKFHVIQDLSKRSDAVRLRIQKKYYKQMNELKRKKQKLEEKNEKLSPQEEDLLKTADNNYYLLKKFSWLLYSNNKKILDPNVEKQWNKKLDGYFNLYDLYDLVIKVDPELEAAIDLKDAVQRFYKKCSYENAKEELEELISYFRATPVEELYPFSKTLVKWKQEIINSFILIPTLNHKKMNNGLIENRNKTIKLIKAGSNGYTCWERFRNRVLYCLNDDETFKL